MDLGITHIFRETFLSSVAVSKQVLTDLGMTEIDVTHITDLFQARDQQLLIEQHAVHHDEKKLIQSARETAAELASLLQQDRDQ